MYHYFYAGTTSCPLSFIEKPYANASIFAIPNTTLFSNESCRLACLNDVKCVSYQINTIITETNCWLQFDINNLKPENTYTRQNVVEFVKGYICTNTGQPTTTTPVVTTTQNSLRE